MDTVDKAIDMFATILENLWGFIVGNEIVLVYFFIFVIGIVFSIFVEINMFRKKDRED